MLVVDDAETDTGVSVLRLKDRRPRWQRRYLIGCPTVGQQLVLTDGKSGLINPLLVVGRSDSSGEAFGSIKSELTYIGHFFVRLQATTRRNSSLRNQ